MIIINLNEITDLEIQEAENDISKRSSWETNYDNIMFIYM